MGLTDRIVAFDDIAAWREEIRGAGRGVVLTNGCFDILHAGHVTYLEEAAALGDVLVVGLNSDRSTRALKGPGRPIHSQRDRAIVLAALSSVSRVVIFDQDDACALIAAVKPDTYAKGGDYTLDTINQDERRLVESMGGEVRILAQAPGVSTSRILAAVLKNERPPP